MVCHLCTRLDWQPSGGTATVLHHLSYEDLIQSAEKGFGACAVSMKAVQLHYNLHHPDSRQSADGDHRELDAQGCMPFSVSTAEIAIDYEHARGDVRDWQMGLRGL